MTTALQHFSLCFSSTGSWRYGIGNPEQGTQPSSAFFRATAGIGLVGPLYGVWHVNVYLVDRPLQLYLPRKRTSLST